ncbi:probable leucine-rich repeat receptor-like protein kinase At2g28990 [Prosopis cineraria]|uniref:probable leucine-rich repeat receptor-like protein kinase At2g28990 n=1 Tax=Prosopis cineraria TaxID=364024 RepID=UPI00240F5238|nr:probable leucine-rich repeat receptor-like protein kinase At2g28990 [Prosopis cineraria]
MRSNVYNKGKQSLCLTAREHYWDPELCGCVHVACVFRVSSPNNGPGLALFITLLQGQKRVINITVNDETILKEPLALEYLKPQTVAAFTNQSDFRFSISATSESDLSFSLDDNPGLCSRNSCKKHKFVILVIVAVLALTVIILVISLGIWLFKFKKKKVDSTVSTKQEASAYSRNRAFSYSEILEITDNFQNLIGQGEFGKVYLGTLKNNTQVAVKLLSQSSMQGHSEFQSEMIKLSIILQVELLMVVHHRHLVSLIGYCEESGVRALIYEYMANGDLHQHLAVMKIFLVRGSNYLPFWVGASTSLIILDILNR